MTFDESALKRENALLRERESKLLRQLVAADQALESFSHSVSHDLRAPLRAIDSLIQILEEDHGQSLGDDGRSVMSVIHDACGRLDQLISGLLAFSRSVRQEFEMVQIDMGQLAKDAVGQVMAVYSGPAPAVDIGALPPGAGDATLLRQVWCHLISNALKFSSKRTEPQLRITGRIEGHETIYQVEDNGTGFDMVYAHKLFNVFQRLHKADEFPGTGVGLAITQRIIARHDGRIWAESAPNAGARFHFALPIVEMTD